MNLFCYLTNYDNNDIILLERGIKMNKDKTLLIMAAGMGSRFGGLKQIEPIGEYGEFLIDYSIYDAIIAGYTKVVFIIKEENYDIFRETVGKRIENKIKVEYAFQKLEDLPNGFELPKDRTKPWGTSHAILSAKNLINEQFTIINADDFYGRDAFLVASKFIDSNFNDYLFSVTGYMIKNVLSKNGAVKRGVCIEKNGLLEKLIESSVVVENNNIIASPLDGSSSFKLNENDSVSMNMLTFTPKIFKYLEEYFPVFLNLNKENILKCEYLIPDTVYQMILEKKAEVKVLPTTALWYGITYKEYKEEVIDNIKKLVKKGEYPNNLWK